MLYIAILTSSKWNKMRLTAQTTEFTLVFYNPDIMAVIKHLDC
jgi:hypothetical protein